MIVMNVKMNNLCRFNDFECNFSYPRKSKRNMELLEDEFLKDAPNFRYKKMIVIMGANACGKTSFGKALGAFFGLVFRGTFELLGNLVWDIKKEATMSVELVIQSRIENDKARYKLFEFSTTIAPKEIDGDGYVSSDFDVKCRSVDIGKLDTYEKAKTRLLNENYLSGFEIGQTLKRSMQVGWNVAVNDSLPTVNFETPLAQSDLYLNTLRTVLMTLEPMAKDVRQVKDDALKGYILIDIPGHPIAIREGGNDLFDSILSRGTKSGFDIAMFVTGIVGNLYGFYYCDEKFAYIQTDFEKAILSLMVSKLFDCDQLFFTTHNLDVLDMRFPMHSFLFMTRNESPDSSVTFRWASDVISHSDNSLRSFFQNDRFNTTPDISNLFSI